MQCLIYFLCMFRYSLIVVSIIRCIYFLALNCPLFNRKCIVLTERIIQLIWSWGLYSSYYPRTVPLIRSNQTGQIWILTMHICPPVYVYFSMSSWLYPFEAVDSGLYKQTRMILTGAYSSVILSSYIVLGHKWNFPWWLRSLCALVILINMVCFFAPEGKFFLAAPGIRQTVFLLADINRVDNI